MKKMEELHHELMLSQKNDELTPEAKDLLAKLVDEIMEKWYNDTSSSVKVHEEIDVKSTSTINFNSGSDITLQASGDVIDSTNLIVLGAISNPGITSTTLDTTNNKVVVVDASGNYTKTNWFINIQNRVTTTQLDKTSNTTLANIFPSPQIALVAGKTYTFSAVVYITCGTTGGFQVAVDGGASFNTDGFIIYDAHQAGGSGSITNTRRTSHQQVVASSSGGTSYTVAIEGSMRANSSTGGGTFYLTFSQLVSDGTTSSALVGSKLVVTQVD